MSEKNFRNELKKIFIGYKHMTPRVESNLASLGIAVGRKRNHIVLFVMNGAVRHSVSISTTGSDKRAGLNIVSKITNTMYGKL